MGEGLASFQGRLRAMVIASKISVGPALIKGAEEIAAAQRAYASLSVDSGDLSASIAVTGPGEMTPPDGPTGAQQLIGINQAAVTAGSDEVGYDHMVEFGTVKMPAQPFFWPGYRYAKKRAFARITRAIRKAIKAAK